MTKDESLKQANDIAVGVDVTKEGTHVVAMRLKPNGVNEVIYSQFHPMAQKEANDGPVQVSPLQFVEMVMEKEHLVGKPIFWAEWPNREKNT